MKKIVGFAIVMTGVLLGAQQFITKKGSCAERAVKPKELLYDLIDLEKRMPNLLHKTADLLQALHMHIEACVDGEKNACTKTKNATRCESYKQAITKVNNIMDKLELNIACLINLLKVDAAGPVAGDGKRS
jgi:hypothetical protein